MMTLKLISYEEEKTLSGFLCTQKILSRYPIKVGSLKTKIFCKGFGVLTNSHFRNWLSRCRR